MPEILSELPKRTIRRPHCSPQERRRIVELSFNDGASIAEIALAHGIHPTSLSHWRSLYRAGRLDTKRPKPDLAGIPATTNFLPVVLRSKNTEEPSPDNRNSCVHHDQRSIVQVTLPSGATLRIESGTLDMVQIGTLLAEMRA
jgi:transposase-like protein